VNSTVAKWLKNLSLYKQFTLPMLIIGLLAVAATLYATFILEDSISALDRMHIEATTRSTPLSPSMIP